MLRGRLFVERALRNGLLQRSAEPFLVVGAGAGGANAAIFAASQQIPTHLIDNNNAPFSTQHGSARWIHPMLYDFPADHCDTKQYPLRRTVPPCELSWSANTANVVANEWLRQLGDAIIDYPHLKFEPHTRPIAQPQFDSAGKLFLRVKTEPPFSHVQPESEIYFQQVLFALGPGPERTYLRPKNGPPHKTRGYSFWKDDPFGSLDFGFLGTGAPQILISGSGDGAIQDFLRIATTCQTTEDAYRLAPLPDALRQMLLSAQDRAMRHLQLGTESKHDHDALTELHRIHKGVADEVLRQGGQNLKNKLRAALRKPLPQLQFFIECTHFSNCYSLNRYLALLFGALIEQETSQPVFLYGRRIIDIQSIQTHHVCADDADDCHGKMHRVTWAPMPDCRGAPNTSTMNFVDANILILRHGIDTAALKMNVTPSTPRLLLPYYLE